MTRRIALLFPGQGSEVPGMGLALAAIDARARRLLELASEHAGVDVARAIERGSRAMGRTEVVQPAIVAVSLAAARALAERGVAVDCVLGHSLGEVTAACLALEVPDADAIALAGARGRAMAEAAAARPGTMIAVRTRDADALAPALACGVTLAAHNAPDEHVLAGDRDAIVAAERALTLPSTRLPVAGAWHSPAMEPAAAAYRRALAVLGDRAPRVPMISTITAQPLGAGEVADALAGALVRPVRFVDALRALEARGVTDVVALAPSRVVRALARRTLPRGLAIHGLDEPRDLDAVAHLPVDRIRGS